MAPQILDAESYGLKSNAKDLIRFLDINMQTKKVAKPWQEAVENTHTGFYMTDSFMQDMMWKAIHGQYLLLNYSKVTEMKWHYSHKGRSNYTSNAT